MPSKEDYCVVDETKSTPSTDYFTSDVEDLVYALKHNLRLKSRPCQVVCSKQRRMSPYSLPVRTLNKKMCNTTSLEHSSDNCKICCLKPQRKEVSDDPYEFLQELLRGGSLIKEAVKRLQLGLNSTTRSKKMNFYEELDDDNLSPRTYSYDA